MFRTVDPVASATLQSYEHWQLLQRARRYAYIKGAVNAVIALLFLLTFPPELRPWMVAIVLADALFLIPYWFLVQRYPTLATCLSLGLTALAISAGDWVGGYQTGASGILYALVILGGHLVLIQPLNTYCISGLITAIYVGTIALEVKGVIPIRFPFTLSNLSRVVSLNVISLLGLTILTSVVTRLYRELLRRNKELFALNAISTAASQSLHLDQVLQLALDRVLEVMELEGGGLYLLQSDTGDMMLKAHRTWSEELVKWVQKIEVGAENLTDSPFRTGQVLVVDVASICHCEERSDEAISLMSKIVSDGNGHRLLAIVPLKADDKVLGVMNLLGQTGYAFTAQDVELLSTIGAQIGMAVERAQLYEKEQKRAVQLAVVNGVAHRTASILDLDQLLQEVVTAIQKSFDYHHVGLFLLDEIAAELELRAIAGGFADTAPPDHHLALGEGIAGWVGKTGKPLLANNVSQEPRYVLGILKEALTQAELCVPLKLAGQVIGVLDIQSTQLNAFDETDLLAMETLADQIATAIENARLFRETKHRFEETMALYQTSLDITFQLEMSELLKSIVERAVTLLEAGGGGIYLYDPQREELRLSISHAYAKKYVGVTLKPGEGMAGKVFQTGEPLIVDDYRTWEGRAPVYEADQPFTAVLEVPLKWQNRIIGVLAIDADRQKRTFNQDDLWLATLFANQAAVAIENARIYEEERRRVTQLELIGGVIQKVASILNLDELLQQVVHLIGDTFNYYRTAVLLVETDSGELVLRAVSSPFETQIGRLRLKIGREGITGWVAHSGEPLLVNNVRREPRYYFLEEVKDTRSELAAPIKLKGEIIGVLDVQSVELDAFSQDDIFVLQTLADQLAVAIENARLYEAERQQLHRLEGLAVASQRITAELDPASVLEEIVAQAMTTLEADRAAVFLQDWETDRLFCAHSRGLSAEYVSGVDRRRQEVPGSHILDSFELIHILDAQTDPSTEDTREAIVREGYHTFAVLPLMGKGKVMGALAVYRDTIRAFSPEQLALAQSFVNQAAVAIENARLYQQTDEKLQARVRELFALYAVAEIVNYSDLDQVLQLALDSAIRLTGMDSGGILLLDTSTHELFLRTHRGWSPGFIRAISHTRADEGFMPHLLQSPLVVDDLSKLTKDRRVAIEREGLQSVVSIPLKAQEKALGVMGVTSRSPRIFTTQEMDLLAAIGNQVGVAVDRANLRVQELRAAILEERQAMARQMHDDIAQTLGYLGLEVDRVMDSSSLAQNMEVQAKLEELRMAIENAYERVRSSIMRLREDVPDHFDLEAALSEILNEFEKQTGCRVELGVDGSQLPRLSPSAAFQATYIIGEALTNARKHSDADSVCLTLQGLEDGLIEITIQDNGRGFDPDSDRQSGRGGFGLRFMRERAERIGASLRIESQPGQGTRVVISLPPG